MAKYLGFFESREDYENLIRRQIDVGLLPKYKNEDLEKHLFGNCLEIVLVLWLESLISEQEFEEGCNVCNEVLRANQVPVIPPEHIQASIKKFQGQNAN